MNKLDELLASQEELFMQLADQATLLEALGQLVRKRDTMTLLLAKHVERLVREKEVLLQHLGIKYLQSTPAVAGTFDTAPSHEGAGPSAAGADLKEFNADVQRYLRECGLLKESGDASV